MHGSLPNPSPQLLEWDKLTNLVRTRCHKRAASVRLICSIVLLGISLCIYLLPCTYNYIASCSQYQRSQPPIAVYSVRCTLTGELWSSIAFDFVALWVGSCIVVGWSGFWMVCCSLCCRYSLLVLNETRGVVERRRDIRELRGSAR